MIGLAVALTIGLAWYAAAAAFVSLLWRLNKAKLDALNVRQLAGLALTAAIVPLVSTFAVTCGMVLPSFFLNEPEQSGEDLSWKLIIFGGCASLILARAIWLAWRLQRRTANLTAAWLRQSEAIEIARHQIYCFDHELPLLAVVGIFRPRIFVARQVLETLNKAELGAAIAHELEHIAGGDNLKRAVLRFCSDLTVFPMFTAIEKTWARCAEICADERAAADSQTAVRLSSALIKIARLFPSKNKIQPALITAAFLVEADDGDIVTRRVRHLIEPKNDRAANKTDFLRFYLFALAVSLSAIVLLFNTQFAPVFHETLETIVSALQ